MRARLLAGLLVLPLLACPGCGDDAPEPSARSTSKAERAGTPPAQTGVELSPAADAVIERRQGVRAVWIYLDEPLASDPVAVVKKAAGKTPWMHVAPAASVETFEPRPALFVAYLQGPEKLNLPDADYLTYKARGFEDGDAERLAKSVAALRLESHADHDGASRTLRAVDALALTLTKQHGVIVEDEETREYFTAKAWEARMARGWNGDQPLVAGHVVIHAIHGEGLLRGITLGMIKFGLPDLVLDEFPRSNYGAVGKLINLTGQSLIDATSSPVVLTVDVHVPSNAHLLAGWTKPLHENATGKARLRLVDAEPQEGDPRNRLLALHFPTYAGGTALERQEACLVGLVGATDAVTRIKHDEAVLKESRRARARLLATLKPLFRKGLPVGASLLVKGPFPVPGGTKEWMWVEVAGWSGAQIEGVLMNDPFYIPDLKAGARVTVAEGDVFDYLYRKPDGSHEGNTTAALIR